MIDHIEDVVISFYAKGMSTEDISRQVNELYGVTISKSTVSNITERILIDVAEWQQRALDRVYLILWLAGIVFKVRHGGKDHQQERPHHSRSQYRGQKGSARAVGERRSG